MTFEDDFQRLTAKILQNKVHITNEESTKQSLIIPFINMLGYDTSNPLEVRSEYSAGFDKTKEKVDYAIFKNDKVIIFIEAKSAHDPLKNHDPQLAKYFNSTPEAKFAIITNGIRYKFYSDLSQPNIIDDTPFFELDFENVKHNDIEILQRFSKELFEVGSLVSYAEELVYYSKLKPEIINLLRNPSDDLIRLLIKKHVSDVKLTFSVIEHYRPIVKNAITDALLEMFRQSIMQNDGQVLEKQAEENILEKSIKSFDYLPESSNSTITNLPSMKILFDWKLIKAGDRVFLKNRPEAKAEVIDNIKVNYKGNILTFNQWGQHITGWKSINIYDWVIVEGQTETLSVLRRNKMLEMEKIKKT